MLITLIGIKTDLHSAARSQLRIAGFCEGSPHHRQGAAIITKLLKEESINENEFIKLAGREVGDKLLEGNVFAFDFDKNQVTFQSTLMKRCCHDNESWWKSGNA
jgi:hypothetical protein